MDTKLVVHIREQSYGWLGLTTENWIAVIAAFIALFVAIIALIQWYSSYKAHKQAHQPILKSTLDIDDSGIGYVALTNSGLGPAMLKKINIKNNGAIIPGTLPEVFQTLADELSKRFHTQIIVKPYRYQEGFPIGKEETIKLVEFQIVGIQNQRGRESGPTTVRRLSTDSLDTNLFDENLQIEVFYEDIFEKQRHICDPQPDKEL